MISIITGIVAGLGIEGIGLLGASGASSSIIIKLIRLAPSIIRIAKAVRSNPDHSRLHKQADEIIKELEVK